MDLKNYSTGVQHIGIPTNDIDKTVDFYHKLGFETAFETVNDSSLVVFASSLLKFNFLCDNNFSIASALFIDRLPISVGLPL